MAYALQSLVHTLEHTQLPHLHHHQNTYSHFQTPLIECLLRKVISLRDYLETSPTPVTVSGSSNYLELLESKIIDAANKAEDIVESFMAAVSSTISTHAMLKVIEEFDSAMEAMAETMDGRLIREEEPYNSSVPGIESTLDPSPKDFVVGLDSDLSELKGRLTGRGKSLEIIPIVGMGGVGKSTLARLLYDSPVIMSHFDKCAWIIVSQDYNIRAILLGLLGWVIGELTDKMLNKETHVLAVDLHKALCGRRFFVVLDDVWSENVWDDVRKFFPDNNCRSRIMLTTRELDVANYVNPSGQHHQMQLLNKSESWKLLRHNVFAQESCSPTLERIGRKIAGNCRGLPLAITVIAGLLSSGKENQDLWEKVARNTSSVVAHKARFLRILSLSYNHLPSHLKPCFLYFGVFPEDSEIRASKLIALWAAEGFLKPIEDKSLEEVGEIYLKSLADRNLILVHKRESRSRIISYRIHDLLRDLCVGKAIQEKFVYVKNRHPQDIPTNTPSLRRVSIHSCFRMGDIIKARELMPLTRSFFCIAQASSSILFPLLLESRLLRVLDVLGMEFYKFPQEILQLVNLRFLAFTCRSGGIPSSISSLRNLQMMIFSSSFFKLATPDSLQQGIPLEFWNLPQLRHVKFRHTCAKIYMGQAQRMIRQENLQTLSNVEICSSVIEKLPNLKKLGIKIKYNRNAREVIHLARLGKLETLTCFTNVVMGRGSLPSLSNLTFPQSLKKLTLRDVIIPLTFMSTFGYLPNLEVLKLRSCAFQHGPQAIDLKWEVADGEFSQLQVLLLEKLNLTFWETAEDDSSPFPRLQRLVIRDCPMLQAIPDIIGDISTLETIEVDESSTGAAAWANAILEEQRSSGNVGPQVRTYGASSTQ